MERRVKVKMADSIAGLADPRPKAVLDARYDGIRKTMRARRPKPFPEMVIEETIAETKLRDRYGEQELGFARDWSFKPDQEVMIAESLARKWEDVGLCTIVEEGSKKAA